MKPWNDLFRTHILERGLNYYEEGYVTSLEQNLTGYTAVVEGTENYDVEIEILSLIHIYGKPASFSFIRFLSMTSIVTFCAAASSCCCCSACLFSAFFPRKYNTIKAMIRAATMMSSVMVNGLTTNLPIM